MDAIEMELFRHQKDDFFGRDGHSPLLPEQKRKFNGLSYYDVNADLSFEVEVKRFDNEPPVQMQTSTGDVAQYVRYGRFSFDVNGQQAELTIYASPNGGGYFLPFTDATSGQDTYGAGRYLDLERLRDGRFHVDFNLAYNPYCAYNPPHSLFEEMGREPTMLYSCPVPPKENHLTIPIRAGEKKPRGPWVEEE